MPSCALQSCAHSCWGPHPDTTFPGSLAEAAVSGVPGRVLGAGEHTAGGVGEPGAGVSGAPSVSFGHSSLEAVMGLEGSSELFTISVNGVLYLQVCGAGSTVGGLPVAGRCAGGLGSCGCSAPASEP